MHMHSAFPWFCGKYERYKCSAGSLLSCQDVLRTYAHYIVSRWTLCRRIARMKDASTAFLLSPMACFDLPLLPAASCDLSYSLDLGFPSGVSLLQTILQRRPKSVCSP